VALRLGNVWTVTRHRGDLHLDIVMGALPAPLFDDGADTQAAQLTRLLRLRAALGVAVQSASLSALSSSPACPRIRGTAGRRGMGMPRRYEIAGRSSAGHFEVTAAAHEAFHGERDVGPSAPR
jgi:hypothetical protein